MSEIISRTDIQVVDTDEGLVRGLSEQDSESLAELFIFNDGNTAEQLLIKCINSITGEPVVVGTDMDGHTLTVV